MFSTSGRLLPRAGMLTGLILSTAALAGAQGLPTAGLVGHWTFDEGSGSVAHDDSGSGHDLTLNGAVWSAGHVGSGAIDTHNGYLLGPADAALELGGSYTVATWTLCTTNVGFLHDQSIVGNHECNLNDDGSWMLYYHPSLQFTFASWDPGGTTAQDGYGTLGRLDEGALADPNWGDIGITASHPQNQWLHLAVTYDSAGNAAKVYMNGELVRSGAWNSLTGGSGTRLVVGTDKFQTGGTLCPGAQFYAGEVDDLRIYDRALSVSEVERLALGQAQCPPTADLLPSSDRMHLQSSTALGENVFFAGGFKLSTLLATAEIDVYDALAGGWGTSTTLPSGVARLQGLGMSGNGKAFFAGGMLDPALNTTNVVDIYDSALGSYTNPGAWSQGTLTSAGRYVAGTVIGDWAIFAGGQQSPTVYNSSVDVYNCVTGVWTLNVRQLSSARTEVQAVTVGDYALFVGGVGASGTGSTVVEYYDSNLGAPTNPAAWVVVPAGLTTGRFAHSAEVIGTRAVIAGGLLSNAGPVTDSVEVYDASLGNPANPAAWGIDSLSTPRYGMSSTVLGNRVMFAGGYAVLNGPAVDNVDLHEPGTGVWSVSNLSVARASGGAGSAYGVAVFAGGHTGAAATPDDTDVVDIFEDCCTTVAASQDSVIEPIALEEEDLSNHNNIVVVHYNPGTTAGTATPADVAFFEIRSAQFASYPGLADPENYALNAVIPMLTSAGTNLPPTLLTLDADAASWGEPFFGGQPASWTIDRYNGTNAPGLLTGSRWHSVMWGDLFSGICDMVLSSASPEEQLQQLIYRIQDGIYHNYNSPEVKLTTALAWDGSDFTVPVAGAVPVRPFLYGESNLSLAGDFSDPALLTGTADPGFVRVWTTAPGEVDTLEFVATNRLGLDIVDSQKCYQENDIIEVQVNMNGLVQDATAFFASISYDEAVLELHGTSNYTSTPFPLHIYNPIVPTGAGLVEIDGSVTFGGSGTTEDALLATLYFRVLAGNDQAVTSIHFTPGSTFPSELTFGGVPVATRLGDPLDFEIDQTAPSFTCPTDIDVNNDPGTCGRLLSITPPPVFDACGVFSFEGVRDDGLALDDPFPAGCAPGAETQITWTAVDCAGHVSFCVQSVRVTDAENPVLSTCPDDIIVTADAGQCDAVVTYADPTATDNCDASPTVSPDIPSGSTFGLGTTSVTYTATDSCGNFSLCSFDVTVQAVTNIFVDVELIGINAPVNRCIQFVTDQCGVLVDQSLAFLDHDGDDGNSNGIVDVTEGGSNTPSTPVRAEAMIQVDCGVYVSLCAKDEQHTMWDSTSLTDAGTDYLADTLLSLEGGDTDNDGDVDINDVSLFLLQFGQVAHPGGCAWDGTRDADFNTSGAIGVEDYAFLTSNWLQSSSCVCTAAASSGSGGHDVGGGAGVWLNQDSRRRSLDVSTDRRLRRLDFNRDRKLDYKDVELFERANGLSGALSRRMKGRR